MRKLFILITCLYIGIVSSQVGVNTITPDGATALDIVATNKGVLIPRLNITNLGNISPVTGGSTVGLLAYNTNTSTGEGFHFWNGSRWVRIDNERNWSVFGNQGTNTTDHFLGTTDNVPIRIKTNNSDRFEVSTDGRLLAFANGTVSNPVFSWFNDADTGLFKPADNQFAISTAGAERMRVIDNGNVGIGISTPQNALHIDGGNATASNIQFTAGTTTGTNSTDGFTIGIDAQGNGILRNQENADIKFFTSNVERMNIEGNGRMNLINGPTTNDHFTVVSTNGVTPGYGAFFAWSNSSADGTSYARDNINYTSLALKSGTGRNYNFGAAGYHQPLSNTNRAGGVIGATQLTGGSAVQAWGSLGYRTSGGSNVGVYGSTSYSNGSGFSSNGLIASGVGVAGFGGLAGSVSSGQIIGQINSGELAATYNQGHQITSGKNIEIVEVNNTRSFAFTNTSSKNQIYEAGVAQLMNGSVFVKYPEQLVALMSRSVQPIINITPMGESKGIFIKDTNNEGFFVSEYNNGSSNIKFNWIIIAERVDSEKIKLHKDLLDNNFDQNLSKFLISDSDLDAETKNASMWFDGQNFRFDKMPDHLEDNRIEPQVQSQKK